MTPLGFCTLGVDTLFFQDLFDCHVFGLEGTLSPHSVLLLLLTLAVGEAGDDGCEVAGTGERKAVELGITLSLTRKDLEGGLCLELLKGRFVRTE